VSTENRSSCPDPRSRQPGIVQHTTETLVFVTGRRSERYWRTSSGHYNDRRLGSSLADRTPAAFVQPNRGSSVAEAEGLYLLTPLLDCRTSARKVFGSGYHNGRPQNRQGKGQLIWPDGKNMTSLLRFSRSGNHIRRRSLRLFQSHHCVFQRTDPNRRRSQHRQQFDQGSVFQKQ